MPRKKQGVLEGDLPVGSRVHQEDRTVDPGGQFPAVLLLEIRSKPGSIPARRSRRRDSGRRAAVRGFGVTVDLHTLEVVQRIQDHVLTGGAEEDHGDEPGEGPGLQPVEAAQTRASIADESRVDCGVCAQEFHRGEDVELQGPVGLPLAPAVSSEVKGQHGEALPARLYAEIVVVGCATAGAMADDQAGNAPGSRRFSGAAWQVEAGAQLQVGRKAFLSGGAETDEDRVHATSPSEQRGLIGTQLKISDERDVAERLTVVEAVADEEVIGHLETAVAYFDVDEAKMGAVEESADLQGAGPPQGERPGDVVEGEARVHHVLDEEDVLVLDRLVEILQEADGLGPCLGVLLGVGADGEEVHLQGQVDGSGKVGHEEHGPSQDRDEEEVLSLIVTGDLSPELLHARGYGLGVEEHLSEPLVPRLGRER